MNTDTPQDRCDRLERIESATLDLLLKFLKIEDMSQFFELICLDIKSALDVELCKILRYDPQRDEFELVSGLGWDKNLVGEVISGENSKAHFTLKRREPVYSEDVASDRRFEVPSFFKENGVVSGLSVPIIHKGKVWGVLGIYSKKKRFFHSEEIRFIEAVASAVSQYLEKLELVENIKKQNKKLELILTYLNDVVVIVDRDGFVRYKSPSVEQVFGWKPEEVVGKHFSEFVHPADLKHLVSLKDKVFANPGKPFRIEYRVQTKGREYRWVEATAYLPENWEELGIEGAIVSERDITEKLNAQEQLLKMAYFDPLTGLPNRFLFVQKLDELIKTAKRRNELVGIVVLDLTRFKEINALYGIDAGDKVIRDIAYRLVGNLRSGDVVSRFFSDEFGIILANIRDMGGLSKAIDKVRAAFKEPIKLADKDIYTDANIGVAVFPKDGEDAETLIRHAELALSRARDTFEGSVAFFSKEIENTITNLAFIKSNLKSSLEKGELMVFYQPIFDIGSYEVKGVEALVRWKHPELGFISPSVFIPVAEESELIFELGDFVLERAVSDLSSLIKEMGKEIYVAVNFSTKQFIQKDLSERISSLLKEKRVKPELFVLEITESTAMREPKRTKSILERLKSSGIKIAIDDFGTGYSSMNYLIEFDVDKIKIDRSFTMAMLDNPKAEGVVKTIIDLSHSIGATSLAEGIEKPEHLSKLRAFGCKEGQGYLFSPPVEFKDLPELLSG